MNLLPALLDETTRLHRHLCPRQVLGVRMGLYAGRLLGLTLPQGPDEKRLYTFVETDGCFADGVSVAANCWLGRRTMRLMDYGKVAAVFVDTQTDRAVRIYPHPQARTLARNHSPEAQSRWHAMLEAYQNMPDEQLFCWQPVALTVSLQALISRAGVRVNCEHCGEEIINEREVHAGGQVLCQSCAHGGYWTVQYDGLQIPADETALSARV